MLKTKTRKKKKVAIPLIIASVIFGIYGASLAVPLAWGLVMSLKVPFEYFTDMLAFPKPMQFRNYIQAFEELQANGTGLLVMIYNSVWFSLGRTFLSTFACMTAGYVCAKYRYTVCKIWYWTVIAAMIIPIIGTMGGALTLSINLGLFDNPLTLVSAYGATGGHFIIMFAFFKGVDWGYAESAFIDGAGHARVFFQIMLPQAISPIIALCLTSFIAAWGDSQTPLVYLPSYPTLASGFYEYQLISGRNANYPVLFAGLFMASIPIIVLYITFQDKLMNLNISGGLKG